MDVSIDDKVHIKRLVTAGNSDIYYEDLDVAAGTMTELDTSSGAIDTSDQLTMTSAFQKVFIANGSNLKIADFINTKLTHTALGTVHARGDILTQDTTNKMIVDFTNTAKTATYGYVTAGTWDAVNAVTGSGSGSGFTPSAVTANPHWYDWVVYPGGSAGTMPEKAYLICVYRGRLTLAGNPQYPNQWYMSKVADPFDFLYGADDPMSAVAGNNADAGQCPDIVRSLISFHDDYLIFGCASTIWILRGDPVAGGSLDNLSDTTGMFGSNSWCFDDNRNLYFWGSGGLYEIKSDFSGIRNLTEMVLPDIINDEAADPSTHRITMGYDKKRHGIVVAITVLATGANSNYFYSFKTAGFYPESYPNECGPYSLFYYDANDTAYADLLVGCKDGYIRKFSTSATDDSTGATTTEVISSYVTYPITPLSEIDERGRLSELVFDLAGGGEGGDFSDTDSMSWRLYSGDDAETVLEKTKATTAWADGINYVIGNLVTYGGLEYICIVAHLSATGAATHEEPDTNIIDWNLAAFSQGTLSGTGRKNKLRPRMRGVYMGLKLYNSTATSTWAINRVLYSAKPAGKVK
jgi:hypothetical protein